MQIRNNFAQPQMLKKSNNKPAFKGINAGSVGKGFLKAIDFEAKETSRGAIMMLYSGCILARIVSSRDKYEFNETTLRDSFGWTALFFAAPAAEKAISYAADKFLNKAENETQSLFINKKAKTAPKKLWDIFKPGNEFILKTAKDIECIAEDSIKTKLLKAKSVSYFSSIGIAAALLGVGIPLLNTINTKNKIAAEKKNGAVNNINMNNFFQITNK